MKIAVLMVGNVRTWEKTKKTFYKFFSGVSIDIYIDTYDTKYLYHPAIAPTGHDREEPIINEKELREQFAGLNVKFCRLRNTSVALGFDRAMLGDKFKESHSNLLLPISHALDTLEVIKEYEEDSASSYSLIIRTRFDILYRGHVKKMFQLYECENFLFHPLGNIVPNDWLFASRLDSMIELYSCALNELRACEIEGSEVDPPHGLFKVIGEKIGLKLKGLDIAMGLLRSDGTIYAYVPPSNKLYQFILSRFVRIKNYAIRKCIRKRWTGFVRQCAGKDN